MKVETQFPEVNCAFGRTLQSTMYLNISFMRHSSTQSETRDKEKNPGVGSIRTIPMLDSIFFQNFFPNHFIDIINILII